MSTSVATPADAIADGLGIEEENNGVGSGVNWLLGDREKLRSFFTVDGVRIATVRDAKIFNRYGTISKRVRRKAVFLLSMLGSMSSLTAQLGRVEQPLILDNLCCNDTLVIRAYFADCGEWGGHTETIAVWHTPSSPRRLEFNYQRDTLRCEDPRFQGSISPESRHGTINPESERMTVLFVKEMAHRSFLGDDGGNAGNEYLVWRTNERHGMRLRYVDGAGQWNGFEELRGVILGKD